MRTRWPHDQLEPGEETIMDATERSEPYEQRSMTRSRLLKLGAGAALAAGALPSRALAGGSPTAVAGGRGSETAAYLRFATYPPLVGESFGVGGAGIPSTQLQLTGATELPSSGEAFSLVFTGPADALLEQATYRVEHPTLRRFDFFLVPIGSSRSGKPQQYEAIVYRLR
jgi:uncharacterized protein DUF6916